MKIWCLLRDQFAHVKPVETCFGNCAEFVYDAAWDPARLLAHKPDMVLCVNDYHYDIVRCLDVARYAGIPSLVLQDGILEWRCQYENPLFGAGGGAPQHQPVMADKIACIGEQSASDIASWGNAHKVEVTGMPRLDALTSRSPAPRNTPGTRVLVMTAKNPGFTAEQRYVTVRSLRDVKDILQAVPGINVTWRVSKAVAEELGVDNQLKEVSSTELAAAIDNSDAVITTPSTAMLEAMLLGRPVAAIDYHNVPRFVQTAWTISAREQISVVLKEILAPSTAKMAFQQHCLATNIRGDGHAAERVCRLITKMVEFSRAQKTTEQKPPMPPNLLGERFTFMVGNSPPLSMLYPASGAFTETNVEQLQLRLARAENENKRLKQENETLKNRTQLSSLMKRGFTELAQTARQKWH